VLLEVDGWPDRTFDISRAVFIKEVAIGRCGLATGNRELNQAGSDEACGTSLQTLRFMSLRAFAAEPHIDDARLDVKPAQKFYV
jgi:hypothetical protein